MTIIVGSASPDGVVLAADSRTTRIEGERHRVLSDSAQKVFAVGPFGVATSGMAFLGAETIAGVMDRFLAQLDESAMGDIEAFTNALGGFFDARFVEWFEDASDGQSYDTDEYGFPLEFLVSGYDDDGVGHIHEVKIPGPARGDYSPNTAAGGTVWRGQTDVIARLVKGVDWLGLALSDSEPLSEEMREQLSGLEYEPLLPITVQDAIDYASFLIRTTIDMQRFSDGMRAKPHIVPGCGGPLQLLVLERSGARWIHRPAGSAQI